MVNITAMVVHRKPLADPPPTLAAGIDPRRYRKVRRFLLGVVLHALGWDLVLNVPFLRRFRRPALPRWVEIARRFRLLAVEMGGVLIKLGQFLSTRVDLLPYEVTRELGGLQDEVPAAAFPAIVAQIEEDFGRPLDRIFARFDDEPIGAASLAQVHTAQLPGGEEVVVKVLRPGIDVLVETDLAVVALAVRWLKIWKKIRQRVDLDRLREEFKTTTHHELDMVAEGHNAERFAEEFADDDGICIPKVYWRESARRTLTLENVAFIKIDNLEALEEAGIDRTAVAEKLYTTYLKQIFHHSFVHADPHPGNLFVRPMPADGESRSGSRPFQIAFVDFGMVAVIPQRLRAAVREYLIGIGTRDAYRIIRAYQQAGMLLPGADLKRLEEAHEAILQHFWGVPVSELSNVAWHEMGYLLREYRDLIIEAPFQVQVDLLFVERAVGILIGLTTHLAPDFDPWAATLPFAKRLAIAGRGSGQGYLLEELIAQARSLLELPGRLDGLVTRVQRGNLVVQITLGTDARKALSRLEGAVSRLTWIVLAAALGVSGTFFYGTELRSDVGVALMVLGGLSFLWSLIRRGR